MKTRHLALAEACFPVNSHFPISEAMPSKSNFENHGIEVRRTHANIAAQFMFAGVYCHMNIRVFAPLPPCHPLYKQTV